MTSNLVSTISAHALTHTTVARETYRDWVLLSLQNLNIDSVAYNHAASEQNWNKQASLWCVSVCASRGLGGTQVLTRTKAFKTKGRGLVSQPPRPTWHEKHNRHEAATPFLCFSLDACEALCWQSAQRWHSDSTSAVNWDDLTSIQVTFKNFTLGAFTLPSLKKNKRKRKRNPSPALNTVSVPSFRLTSATSHPWLCYYRVVMLF